MKHLIWTLLLAIGSVVPQTRSATDIIDSTGSGFSSGLGFMLGIDPSLEWREIQTPHFRIFFPSKLEPMARKSAGYLEEVHLRLKPWLQWEPRERIEVRVLDSSDSHNGMAAATLRIGITLWGAPPEAWSSTTYADDWLRLTCLHEYIHILNMDPTRSWIEPLRILFGDLVRPNSLWTTWMLEGLAVYGESRFSLSGRGRSTLWSAILRAAVEENRFTRPDFMSLDRLMGTNPWFPGGESVYLFGYNLMSEVAHDARFDATHTTADGEKIERLPYGGELSLGELSKRSAGRVPFFFDDNLNNVIGRSWPEIWRSWQDHRSVELQAELHSLRSQPITPYRTLVGNDYAALGVTVSGSGKSAAYSLDSLHDRMGLYLLDRETGKSRRLGDKTWGVGMRFTPDERGLIYSSLERQSILQQFSDLAFIALDSGKVTYLTSGKRAKDPDLHQNKDGTTSVIFAQNESDEDAGTTAIWRAELRWDGAHDPVLRNFARLWKPPVMDRIAQPKFSSDGQEVAFSWKVNGELGERICRMPADAKAEPTCLQDGSFNHFAAYDANGELTFVSDRTGIDNLYRWKQDQIPERITHVTTAFWLPAWTPDGKVLGSRLSSTGWELVELTPTPQAEPINQITTDAEPHDSLTAPNRSLEAETELDIERAGSSQYHPLSTWKPRDWSPYFMLNSSSRVTEVQVGALVNGFDATDIMGYSLFGAYNTRFGVPQLSADLAFRQLGPQITATLEHYPDLLSEKILSRSTAAAVSITYPLARTWSRWSPQARLSTVYEHRSELEGLFLENAWVPRILFGLKYSNLVTPRLAISPESGRRWELSGQGVFRSGSQTWKLFSGYSEYFRLIDHAVLMAQANISGSNQVSWDGTQSASYGTTPVIWSEVTPSTNLRSLFFRGYPGTRYFSTLGAQLILETRLPIFRWFRGIGTLPLFFENIWAKGFVESGALKSKSGKVVLFPAAGAGLHLDLEALLFFPVGLSAEYHVGLDPALGGQNGLFFQIVAASPLPF